MSKHIHAIVFLFSMPFLAYSRTFWLWMMLLFSSSGMTQLTFNASCYNVVINKGTAEQSQIDGNVRIENAFDIVHNITAYANRMLTAVIWNPNFARGNKHRVLVLSSPRASSLPRHGESTDRYASRHHESFTSADIHKQLSTMITQFYQKTGMTQITLIGLYIATRMKIISQNLLLIPEITGTQRFVANQWRCLMAHLLGYTKVGLTIDPQ